MQLWLAARWKVQCPVAMTVELSVGWPATGKTTESWTDSAQMLQVGAVVDPSVEKLARNRCSAVPDVHALWWKSTPQICCGGAKVRPGVPSPTRSWIPEHAVVWPLWGPATHLQKTSFCAHISIVPLDTLVT